MYLKAGVLACLFACRIPNDTPRIPQVQREAAVLIYTSCGLGSGVIIGKHQVLTAYHVIRCAPILVVTQDGTMLPATVEREESRRDLIRLRTDGMSLQTATIGPLTPSVGDAVVGSRVCSAPAYPSRDRACGAVIFVNSDSYSTAIAFSGTVVGGNSGSGLYDSRGRLVGIVTRRSTYGGLATIVPSWLIQ